MAEIVGNNFCGVRGLGAGNISAMVVSVFLTSELEMLGSNFCSI